VVASCEKQLLIISGLKVFLFRVVRQLYSKYILFRPRQAPAVSKSGVI
jgi:hypothetical protein